jgi:hypothetical protein
MKKFGTTRYIRNVIARWPGNAARLLEWTPKNSFAIAEETTDEDGRPIEQVFDVDVEEATAVLGVPEGFVEPELGSLITITKSGSGGSAVTKAYVLKAKERPEKAGAYLKFSCTLENKEYVDYATNNLGA